MNRLVRGSVMLAAAIAVLSCGGDPTSQGADATDHLVSDPSILFIDNNGTQAVIVEALNPLGQQLAGDFQISDDGTGITVVRDTAFGVIFGQAPTPTRARFEVTPVDSMTFVSTSFTITANGKSVTVPVNITPSRVQITFSNLTPALGEVITLTAPAGLRFTDSSAVSVGLATGVVTGVSPDGSQISFLIGPNINLTAVRITNVEVIYLPGQVFTIGTVAALTTPTVAAIPTTFSTATPQVGDTVTLTLTPPFKALPTATVSFSAGGAIITGISADSSQISFLPTPGSTGAAALTNVIVDGVPVPISLPSSSTLTVAATTTYTGTAASATAPLVAFPSTTGGTTAFFDLGSWAGNCGGVPCQWYRITVTTAGDYFITSEWDNNSDLGIFVIASNGTTVVAGFDAHGNGATAQPEEGTVTLAAGNYFIQVQNFAPFYPDPDPTYFKLTFTLP